MNNTDQTSQATPPKRSKIALGFDEILPGRSWFTLYLPGPASPLGWREVLVFSACAYLTKGKRPPTYKAVARMTSLKAQTVSKITTKLGENGLLTEGMVPVEPDDPTVFFAVKRNPPLRRTWTDLLMYTRYYVLSSRRHGRGTGLEPYDSLLFGFLALKHPRTTTVSYLSACTGIDRRQVRASLGRLAEHGITTQPEAGRLAFSYAVDIDPDLFRPARRKASRPVPAVEVEYPAYLLAACEAGKITAEYLPTLAGWVQKTESTLFPNDWTNLINSCWAEHQSFKAKTGRPFFSMKMLANRVNDLIRSRQAFPTAC